MENKKTQIEWTIKRLEDYGQVSRNDALRNYISRLGAIIYKLTQDGWAFTTERDGGDYVYKVLNSPLKKALTLDEQYDLFEPRVIPKTN